MAESQLDLLVGPGASFALKLVLTPLLAGAASLAGRALQSISLGLGRRLGLAG